jgi:hypothetical protein
MLQCFTSQDNDCNILDCDLGDGASIDFAACGCDGCINPMMKCLDDCTPLCLDEMVDPFIDCLLDGNNECFSNCIGYQGVGNAVTFPPITPNENCDLTDVLQGDLTSCLPNWPTCEEVQETAIDATCDATSCCSPCWEQKLEIEKCVYRWLSGEQCNFDCDGAEQSSLVVSKSARSSGERPEFVEACRSRLVGDLLVAPDTSFNDYVECIMSNSMELAADESNRPVPTEAPTEPPVQGTTSGASGPLMVALPISIAVIFGLM